jgi:glutathione S-transferase
MLPRRASTVKAWSDRAPALEQRLVPILYPLLAAAVRANLKLHTGSVPEQRAIMDESLTRLEPRLGGRYLVGDSLTAADLAFASLFAPAVLPSEYPGPLPAYDELPDPMRREVDGFRRHPAGEFTLRLYREERAGR